MEESVKRRVDVVAGRLSALIDENPSPVVAGGGADDPLVRLEATARAVERTMQRYELELGRLRDELARRRAELEQLAYGTSHDLREPVRNIVQFTQLLQRRTLGQLDATADKYIDYVLDASDRLDAFLASLLTYSRIGLADHNEPVALEEVVGIVLERLAPEIEAGDVYVHHGTLPIVRGDRSQFLALFQAVVENAVHYRADEGAEVLLYAEREGAHWRFVVRDNGIGIEPQHTEHIFQMFQRLHSNEGRRGSGMGLAIARRVVEHYRGRIWVESSGEGKGASVFFTLPAPPEPEDAM